MASSLRRQWHNLALIGAAAVLALLVFLTRDRITSAEAEARARHVLAAFREDEIRRITLTRPGSTIVLERSLDDAGSAVFRLRAPVQEPADPYAVDQLLGSLEFATPVRRIEPGQVDRGRFGLGSGNPVLEVDMGAIRYQLRFGGTSPSPRDARYVELAGSGVVRPGVMIISADLARELLPEPDELREKQLIPYSSSALERLSLAGVGGSRRLYRPERGPFRFDGQLGNRRLGRAAVDALLLELARAKAEHFLAPDQARGIQAGVDTIRVELTPRDRKLPRAVVTFGGPCPKSPNGVVAVRSEPRPIAACVPKSVFSGLSVDAERLQDRALIALHADEIERLEIRHGPDRLDLTRTPAGFELDGERKTAVEREAGNQRLAELAAAHGRLVEQPDLARLGLAPPDGTVLVRSATGDALDGLQDERLLFGVRGGKYHVLREADGAVLELAAESVRALSTDKTLLRPRRVLDFKPDRVRELSLRTPGAFQRAVRAESGRLELVAPAGYALDAGLTSDLLEALSTLEAERWAAERATPEMQLAAPRMRVELRLDPDHGGGTPEQAGRELALLVGAPTSGGSYARLSHDPAVFVLDRSMTERLELLLLDRSVFLVDPAGTDAIELRARGRTIRLEKSGTRFVEVGNSPRLRPEQVAEIIEVLSSLRPEAAVRIGPSRAAEGLDPPRLEVRASAGGRVVRSFRVGRADSFHDMNVRYARRDGSDVSYVIAASKLAPLLDHF